VPKKVEKINDHLFIDIYKSNNIKIGVNDIIAQLVTRHKSITISDESQTRGRPMTVNDSKMCMCEMKRSLS